MPVQVGDTLLHYRIVEKIGEGGMGVVWKAVDSTLDRAVAIKVLPEALAADPDRLERFEREAKLLASLNHPNIATLHSIHLEGDVRFLAMELIEGEDLAQRLARGPLDVEEVLPIGKQIAEALEAAHEAGVIHRDIKPANVKLMPDGKVKVLDFGLAKALGDEPASGTDPAMSPTLTARATLAGMIMGTAGYMSPEQARGKAIDRRTDIWSFGCVLYEMLTGRRLFGGETVSDTLAAVLRATPDLDALPRDTPAELRRIVRRCLDRDPRTRLRDIGEARVALSLTDAVAEDAAVETPSGRRPGLLLLAVLTLAGVALGLLVGRGLRPATELRERKLTLATPIGLDGPRARPRISPNGRSMAYIAAGRLWVQSLDSLTPRPLPEGDGASDLAWSPDSTSLVFAVRSKLWRAEVNGEPVLLAELPNAIGASGGLTWSEQEGIVYATGDDNLYTVPVAGGKSEVLLAPDLAVENDFHMPSALPGGGLLFPVHKRDGSIDEIHAFRDGRRKRVYGDERNTLGEPVYSPTGHLIFAGAESNSGLWAVPFSLARLEVTGQPVRITDQGSEPSASADGVLLYSNVATGGRHQLVLADRAGNVSDRIGDPVPHADNVTLSPDGNRFAVCVIEPPLVGLWIYDLARRGARSRINASDCGGTRGQVAWAPDGAGLSLGRVSEGTILRFGVEGQSAGFPLTEGEQPTFTADGRHAIFVRIAEETRWDLWSVELAEDGSAAAEPRPWLEYPGRQGEPHASPTDPLVAFVSDESGRNEVYLTAFPEGVQVWQVSIDGGMRPRWSADGKRLFYLQDEVVVMEVEVELTHGDGRPGLVRLSEPQVVFAADDHDLVPTHGWDVVGTGEAFLTVEVSDVEVGDRDLTLITDWNPEARSR